MSDDPQELTVGVGKYLASAKGQQTAMTSTLRTNGWRTFALKAI